MSNQSAETASPTSVDWDSFEGIPHLPVDPFAHLPGHMAEKPAGDVALRGLAAYAAGDFDAARRLSHVARRASGDAFAARYADGLAYAAIGRKGIHTATTSVRRFLIAIDDPRQALTPLVTR